MSEDISQEFAGLGDDVTAVLAKPEVLTALTKLFEKREAPLKAKRDELLGKISETNETIKALGGLDSIKGLAQQAAEARAKAEQAAANSTDVETVKKTYSEKLSASEARYASLQGKLVDKEVADVLGRAVRDAKGVPELLMPQLKGRVKADVGDDGSVRVAVLGANGVPMLRDDGKEATVKDLVEEFRSSSVYARAFEATNTGGSGARDGARALTGVTNPWMTATKNVTQQMTVARDNPTLAMQLAAAAGVALSL